MASSALCEKINLVYKPTCVVISPDGAQIIYGSDEGYVTILDYATKAIVISFPNNQRPITSIAANNNCIIVGDDKGRLYIYDKTRKIINEAGIAAMKRSGEKLPPLFTDPSHILKKAHMGSVHDIIITPDNLNFISISRNQVIIWQMDNLANRILETLGDIGAIMSVAIGPAINASPNERLILVGTDQGFVCVWRWKQDGFIMEDPIVWRPHNNIIKSIAVSKTGTIIGSSYDRADNISISKIVFKPGPTPDGFVYDITTNILTGHDDRISNTCLSQDNVNFISGTMNGQLHICNTESGIAFCELEDKIRSIVDVAFAPTPVGFFVACDNDKTLFICNYPKLIEPYNTPEKLTNGELRVQLKVLGRQYATLQSKFDYSRVKRKDEIVKFTEEKEAILDERICKICSTNVIDTVYISCGHTICGTCAEQNFLAKRRHECPFCRQISPNVSKLFYNNKYLKYKNKYLELQSNSK